MTQAGSDTEFSFSLRDRHLMSVALSVSARGRGRTAENPNVGCVITAPDGRIIGTGRTGDGGRPHAEVNALEMTQAGGEPLKGATAYVTLEPCSHTGKTGPCAEAIVSSGIARVVVAIKDPDPRVSGRGIQRLRQAGLTVETGLMADEARRAMAGFLSRMELRRPHLTLKLATSLDGRSALVNGVSQWITNAEARAHGHLLRARSDAILTGAATVLADNPQLTCRLPGLEGQSPRPVILDPSDDLTGSEAIFTRDPLVLTGDDARDLPAVMTRLADAGINWLMAESGGRLAASLLRADLVDELHWYRGDQVLGGDAKPALADLGLEALTDATCWQLTERRRFGSNQLEVFGPCSQA